MLEPDRDGGPRAPTLLIADDDPVARSILIQQLRTDFEVCWGASDAVDAIDLASGGHPDVALVDVNMPSGGGLAAVRGIVSESPSTAVVVLSGDDLHDSVIELLEAGAVSYLRKGTPGGALVDALHDAIRAHRALDPQD